MNLLRPVINPMITTPKKTSYGFWTDLINLCVLTGKLSVRLPHTRKVFLPDKQDFLAGQFPMRMTIPTNTNSMTHSIPMITLLSIPTKIAQIVVGWITIVVTTLHAFRSRTNEGEQHETMNQHPQIPFAITESNPPVRFLLHDGQLSLYPLGTATMPVRMVTPHRTVITNLVFRISEECEGFV